MEIPEEIIEAIKPDEKAINTDGVIDATQFVVNPKTGELELVAVEEEV